MSYCTAGSHIERSIYWWNPGNDVTQTQTESGTEVYDINAAFTRMFNTYRKRFEIVSKTHVAFTRQQISDTFRKSFSWNALSKTH
jgi:hypothetical protein